jgi:hypothetical protein
MATSGRHKDAIRNQPERSPEHVLSTSRDDSCKLAIFYFGVEKIVQNRLVCKDAHALFPSITQNDLRMPN